MKKIICRFKKPAIVQEIICGRDILNSSITSILKNNYSSIYIIADRNVLKHFPKILQGKLSKYPIMEIPSGEKYKSQKYFNIILEWLHQHHADRASVIIALGGGVVTDLAGFAASSYMRGIDFVAVPTTLLCQVDAAIGGKTAINLKQTKNIIGSFHPACAVICDSSFLDTLPTNYLRDGLVEALKMFVALSKSRFKKYQNIKKALDDKVFLDQVIFEALELKVRVVNKDPLEKGLRKVLNFGHTAGHAYEATAKVSHGKAVAYGMLIALTLSKKLAGLTKQEEQTIRDVCLSLYANFRMQNITSEILWEQVMHDKKKVGNKAYFTLLSSIGGHIIKPITFKQFDNAFNINMELLSK